MRNILGWKIKTIFILGCMMIIFTNAYADTIKIKVVTENASIQFKPDITSNVIETVPKGKEFESEEKIGEWFKIKFSSRLGILITGYIHERFVKVESEALEPEKMAIQKPEKPVVESEAQEVSLSDKKIKVNVEIGGLFSFQKDVFYHEYGYPYRNETFNTTDYIEAKYSFGVRAGVGIFITPKVEISGNVSFFPKSSWREFGIEVPSPYLFDESKGDDFGKDSNFKETIICLGVLFHPVENEKYSPYFGGGGNFVLGKIEMLEGFWYSETKDDVKQIHSVDIGDVTYTETSVSIFGFFLKAGINFNLFNKIGAFTEVNYTFSKKGIEHLMYQDVWIDVDLGGFMICAGIKIFLNNY